MFSPNSGLGIAMRKDWDESLLPSAGLRVSDELGGVMVQSILNLISLILVAIGLLAGLAAEHFPYSQSRGELEISAQQRNSLEELQPQRIFIATRMK